MRGEPQKGHKCCPSCLMCTHSTSLLDHDFGSYYLNLPTISWCTCLSGPVCRYEEIRSEHKTKLKDLKARMDSRWGHFLTNICRLGLGIALRLSEVLWSCSCHFLVAFHYALTRVMNSSSQFDCHGLQGQRTWSREWAAKERSTA